MTNYDKHDMFITVAKAFGNEIEESKNSHNSNEKTLAPASFNNIANMLQGF